MSGKAEGSTDGQTYRLVTLPLHHLFPGSSTIPANHTSPSSSDEPTGKAQEEDTEEKPSRALIACVACRARKIKCSGDRPVCVTCAKSSQTCIYNPHAKRKRKTKAQLVECAAKKRSQPANPSLLEHLPQIGHVHAPESQVTDTRNETQVILPEVPHLGVPGPSTYAQPIQNPSPIATGQTITPTSVVSPALNITFDNSVINPSTELEFINKIMSGLQPDQPADSIGLPSNGICADTHWNWDEFLRWDPAIGSSVNTSNNASGQTYTMNDQQSEQTSHIHNGTLKTRFRVPYFRFFGPTAIAPGYKQVQYGASCPPSPTTVPKGLSVLPTQDLSEQAGFMDQNDEYPHLDALQSLLPVFNLHFNYFFPFLRFNTEDIPSIVSSKPSYLLNIICAISARFSPFYSSHSPSDTETMRLHNVKSPAARVWATKAKEQVSRTLSFSTVEIVETLLLISWYEFGQDRDGGLWMYSGMGLRMGQDLGLDSINRLISPHLPPHDTDDLYARQLHCSLILMDVIMTIGTGRRGMYLSTHTIVPALPEIASEDGNTWPDPYIYLVKILVLADKVARILRVPDKRPDVKSLEAAQNDLNGFHTSLPVELRFETSAFQRYAKMGHGGTFVLLHLWLHTLIILVYQPSLLGVENLEDYRLGSDGVDIAGQQIAASSAKTILDIATFAELIDAKANSQPWINYPLYIAGCMFISQCLDTTDETCSAGQIHLAKIARANFQRIIGLFDTLQSYWAGVRYIRGALLQKAEGTTHITLVDSVNEPLSGEIPPTFAAMWSGQSETNHLVGLSFTGTMNSPTDNFFSLVYPQASSTLSSTQVTI
ncbi:uncharacterized protein I206_104431 [Kwoniella pini CBS 10737]|uniref:Zn(2)-C6 fungal-type domain-containing protein n=1 Tax=Kwoniella pini CBS 10737 TaxID=1296096 RepID=A0AAJ8L7D1_9TREE